MNDIAIRVSNLSKCYQIYDKPHDRLKQSIYPRLQRLAGKQPKQYFREFWALKGVSFEIGKGETVGIVGRNGSGKSTLLQLICGTLNPTSGSIQASGRIAALLELGSGFNPEFTGRENVYMNAAVLGLSRDEIEARFDEIVAFADIGEFIEQPVKTYSSGMFVRLAFAVAVHVEPDILVVDEALSVGDLAFQNKCMMKIRELRDQGTTLLFVAHDLSILQMICERVAWINRGEIVMIGDSVSVCQEYYVASLEGAAKSALQQDVVQQENTGLAHFLEFRVINRAMQQPPSFRVGDRLTMRFALKALDDLESSVYGLSIYRSDGDYLIGQTSREVGVVWPPARKGDVISGNIVLESLFLAPGEYRIALGAFSQDLAICYGMTGMLPGFSVHTDFPTWGKIIHPCKWVVLEKNHFCQR